MTFALNFVLLAPSKFQITKKQIPNHKSQKRTIPKN